MWTRETLPTEQPGSFAKIARSLLLALLALALLLAVRQVWVFAAGAEMQNPGPTPAYAPPATSTPMPPAESCYPGTGWTWTYGPFQPDLATTVQGALHAQGIEASVQARLFGETDSCGTFAPYAVDFTIVLTNQAPIDPEEQQEIARRIYPLLAQYATPRIGQVTLTFPATGDKLVFHEPPGAAPQPSPTPPSSLQHDGFHRRIYLVVYDPQLSNGQLLHEYMGWFDFVDLTQAHIDLIYNASSGYVQYEVVSTVVVTDEWPIKIDGFRYTETEYLDVIAGTSPAHVPDTVDYNAILNTLDLDICGKLNRGAIDELWLFGGPYFGYYESTLAGPGGYLYNSPPVADLNSCDRLLPIMGFNYERADGTGHIFGHRMEATMVRVYGDWQQNRTAHNLDRFGLVLAQSPDYWYSGCGSIHYPPNGTSDYDYGNPATAPTTCYDFVNYPNLGDPLNTAQPVTCTAWNCDHADFMAWWHGHLPSNPGCGPDDVANNWWNYFAEPAHANAPLSACQPDSLKIAGPALGSVDAALTFSATLTAITATPPITFFWQATGQVPVTHTSGTFHDTQSYTWTTTGTKAITVSATYTGGSVVAVYTPAITSTHLLTASFAVSQPSDDAGLAPACTYSTGYNEIYFGQCNDGQDIISGFRFAGVTIPRGSKILDAYLEFTVDGYYSNDLTVVLFGEAAGDAQTFGYLSRPDNRPLTAVSTTWPITASDAWNMGQKRRTPDLSPIVQEVVNRADWDYGNALAIITHNGGPTNPANIHRRVFAYERYGTGQGAARLVVHYAVTGLMADFDAAPRSGGAPLTVQFTDRSLGQATTWLWDFGDGTTSPEQNPEHTFALTGTYTIALDVSGLDGSDTLTRSGYITVYEMASAHFSAAPLTGTRPLTVTFANESTGDFTTCAWNFGDGGTSNDCNDPEHTYTTAGAYTVSLAVAGPGGSDALTRTNYITVYEPVQAHFGGTPLTGTRPLTVTLTNESTGDFETCAWAFGDGEASSDCNDPEHTYTATGAYSVSLAVAGPGGSDALTRTNYITIYEPVHAHFAGEPLTGTRPLTVTLTNESTGDFETCAWDFGDGETSTDCNDPEHTYAATGTYSVSLAVAGLGGSDTLTRSGYITVYEPVRARFWATQTSGLQPLSVTFRNKSTGDYTTCAWDLGDGGTSSDCTDVAYTYVTAGTYTVTLTVSGPGGQATRIRTNYITVRKMYKIYLPLLPGYDPLVGIVPDNPWPEAR